jgi:hypothetical protein
MQGIAQTKDNTLFQYCLHSTTISRMIHTLQSSENYELNSPSTSTCPTINTISVGQFILFLLNAGQNALVFVLHKNEAQNSCSKLSCTESSGSKNCRDRPFHRQDDDAERITATGIMVNNRKEHAKSSHGIRIRGHYCNLLSKHGKQE